MCLHPKGHLWPNAGLIPAAGGRLPAVLMAVEDLKELAEKAHDPYTRVIAECDEVRCGAGESTQQA